ncbi:MAG TPA: peptidase M61, partial [Bacteroidia bacterium]
MRKLLLLLSLIIMKSSNGSTVNYTLDIKNPNSHYAKVSLEIKDHGGKITNVKMPVWAPGSYMIREFERNIDQVKAFADGKPISINKTDKSTWSFKPVSKTAVIQIEYDIYCYESSVRTSFISNDHAFLIFSSVLMYADPQNQKGNLSFVFPDIWKKISCTLPQVNDRTFSYSNLDELIDSPVEIGNHDLIEFEVAGVKHTVAMVGKNNCDYNTFKTDLTKVCSTMYNIVGAHPCKSYLFIVHNVEEG